MHALLLADMLERMDLCRLLLGPARELHVGFLKATVVFT